MLQLLLALRVAEVRHPTGQICVKLPNHLKDSRLDSDRNLPNSVFHSFQARRGNPQSTFLKQPVAHVGDGALRRLQVTAFAFTENCMTPPGANVNVDHLLSSSRNSLRALDPRHPASYPPPRTDGSPIQRDRRLISTSWLTRSKNFSRPYRSRDRRPHDPGLVSCGVSTRRPACAGENVVSRIGSSTCRIGSPITTVGHTSLGICTDLLGGVGACQQLARLIMGLQGVLVIPSTPADPLLAFDTPIGSVQGWKTRSIRSCVKARFRCRSASGIDGAYNRDVAAPGSLWQALRPVSYGLADFLRVAALKKYSGRFPGSCASGISLSARLPCDQYPVSVRRVRVFPASSGR